jgi:DNA (cytosine-5)-methyltransferase 1
MKCVGLFSGIGGVELAFQRAGHETALLCEIDPAARRVLKGHFPDTPIAQDVRKLDRLPQADIVTAGFPCQDLSQAGMTRGIRGANSGLVRNVFRLIDGARRKPRWIVLENVPFMLKLDSGRAMRYLTGNLEELGYSWAYRLLDARAFGLPQRRRRVILVASRTEDPRRVLFGAEAKSGIGSTHVHAGRGFYWTEGRTGLGWALGAVPTLKGGSTIGIPSPPAVWFPKRRTIELPGIRDAERLQGFEVDWTKYATEVDRKSRWRLIGNAVCVPMLEWVAKRLNRNIDDGSVSGKRLKRDAWPDAAWGAMGKAFEVEASAFPVRRATDSINAVLRFKTSPLSIRAAQGFHDRASSSGLSFEDGFLDDVSHHIEVMRSASA